MTPEDVDPKLVELSRNIDEFVDETMKPNSGYALFCIAGRLKENADELEDRLQTCLAASGNLSIIEESIQAELTNQLLNKDARLFFLLSDVIATLEEQLGDVIAEIEEEQDLSDDPDDSAESSLTATHTASEDDDILSGFDITNLDGVLIIEPDSTSKKVN